MDFRQGRQNNRQARGWLRAGAGLIALVAALALGATPAGAILFQTHKGHYLSYERIQGKAAPSNVTPSNAARSNALSPVAPSNREIFGDELGYMNYSGGPLMTANKNYVINWDPPTYTGPQYGSGGSCGFSACTGFVAGVNTFFQDLQAASGGNQPSSDQVAIQYVANGQAPNYSSSAGGVLTDTHSYPASACPAAPPVAGGVCLTDAQLQAELQSFLASQGAPNGTTNEYFLLTPPGVASCFDTGGQQCSGNAGSGGKSVFCAYHGRTTTSSQYIYSNIPDLDEVEGCDPFSTTSPGSDTSCSASSSPFTCIWPNGYADGVLSAVSHEHNESITDPEPDNAWADWSQLRNKPGDENGDKCNNDGIDDPNLTVVGLGGNAYTAYNETFGSGGGHHYLVQMEWSNQGLGCIDRYTSTGSGPGASFSVASQSGNNVNFSATAGAAQYVWQFNDNTTAGDAPQQFTVTTTSPTISHAFPGPGTYTVALTAMSGSGLSQGSSQDVTIASPPPPAGAPNTSITKFKAKAKKRKAKFTFSGSGGQGALRFQCMVDGILKWTKCSSPVVLRHLKLHKRYTFEVRAIDSAGKKDRTPAKKSFKL